MLTCARSECEEVIEEKKKHNQIYCSDECCRLATNEKLREKYKDRRDRAKGNRRDCKECGQPLSRYNESRKCQACATKADTARHRQTQNLLSLLQV